MRAGPWLGVGREGEGWALRAGPADAPRGPRGRGGSSWGRCRGPVRAPLAPHPCCGEASGCSCPGRVSGSRSWPGAAPGGPRASGPGLAGQGRWRSSPLAPAPQPLPTPTLHFSAPQWAWCPFAAEGAPGVEEGNGGGREQRQVVEGARAGARRLVILMRISFSPLPQGARRCVCRRRREGQRHGSGEGRLPEMPLGSLSLISPPTPTPEINKVAGVMRVEEFDEALAQNWPELPLAGRLAPARAYPEPHTLSTPQRLGGGGGGCL